MKPELEKEQDTVNKDSNRQKNNNLSPNQSEDLRFKIKRGLKTAGRIESIKRKFEGKE